eukprot:766454-Hanusia_phi.AAC.19
MNVIFQLSNCPWARPAGPRSPIPLSARQSDSGRTELPAPDLIIHIVSYTIGQVPGPARGGTVPGSDSGPRVVDRGAPGPALRTRDSGAGPGAGAVASDRIG